MYKKGNSGYPRYKKIILLAIVIFSSCARKIDEAGVEPEKDSLPPSTGLFHKFKKVLGPAILNFSTPNKLTP